MSFIVLGFVGLLWNGIYGESLVPGNFLTLSPCGKYTEYQQWNINSGKTISLTNFDDSCIICSNEGYCNWGFIPTISNDCSSNNYMLNWNINYGNDNTVTISGPNNLCIQSIGANDYGMILTMQCNLQYNNNIYQEFVLDTTNKYIKSNVNDSLCLTAYYYPRNNCSQSPFNTYDYCDMNLPINTRVNDILNRMNIFEKISNLQTNNIGVPRLGIKPNAMLECLHGIRSICGKPYNGNTGCPTSFPHALLLGATFNRTLWKSIGKIISDEGRALYNQNIGGLFCFSPDINLFRDPRWGRGQEVPGEDPFLTGEYAREYVNAIQRDNNVDPRYLKMSNTVKHFADYSLEGGRYGVPARTDFNGIVSTQDQMEYYFPAWREVIESAHAKSMMCSYPAINGVPACGNDLFMNQIARDEWDFDGFILSDEGAIADGAFTNYVNAVNNGTQDTELLRTQIGLEHGCDLNIGYIYTSYALSALNNGYIDETTIDTALSRLFKTTIELGQLDFPGPIYNGYGPANVDTPEARELALNAAQQGIVLLKNEKNILPLKKNGVKYGFIGPHFNITQYMLSSYVGTNTLVNSHSPYQVAIEQGIDVIYAQGCDVSCLDDSQFNQALDVAAHVDIVILFVGLYPLNYAQPSDNSSALEAENKDRYDLTFPGYQLELIKNVTATNQNVVLVLFGGSPIDITWPKGNIPGIINSFYPGELGGDALISILFGDYNPAGKLPITMYPNNITIAREMTDMSLNNNGGITYRYYTGEPVYPFGFGLYYTTFQYTYYNLSNTEYIPINTTKLYKDKSLNNYKDRGFTVGVTNTGSRDSDCIVIGYMKPENQETGEPNIKLFDFERTFVKTGQTVNVTLSVSPYSISRTNKKGITRIVPGKYTLFLGDYSNNNYITYKMELIGNEIVLFDLSNVKQ